MRVLTETSLPVQAPHLIGKVGGAERSVLTSSRELDVYLHTQVLLGQVHKVQQSFSNGEAKSLVESLPPDLKGALFEAVWYQQGCPDLHDAGEHAFYQDPSCLTKQCPAFLHPTGGNLLDQLQNRLKLRLYRDHSIFFKTKLQQIKNAIEERNFPRIEELLQRIPPEDLSVLARIFNENPQVALIKDAHCTESLRKLDGAIAKYKDNEADANSQEASLRLTQFERIVHDPRIDERRLKLFYHGLGALDHEIIGRDLSSRFRGAGINSTLHHEFGAHLCETGCRFQFYSPYAARVEVLIHREDGRVEGRDLTRSGDSWKLFLPGVTEGTRYEFKVTMGDGRVYHKADPFARGSCLRPDTKSVVRSPFTHKFSDDDWMKARVNDAGKDRPSHFYEVHPGAWRGWKNYRELASELAGHCKYMGYSHVQLFGVLEHGDDGSLGYQMTGPFNFTSRFGSIGDFQAMVDQLHKEGIGVVVDFAPHFATSSWGLGQIGGYEKGEMTDWGTYKPDFESPFVRDMLVSAICHLAENHVDGVRLDNVEMVLKTAGGRLFLQELSTVLKRRFPGFLLITENALDDIDTIPVDHGGLGADLKHALGYMGDLEDILRTDPVHRGGKIGRIRGSVEYALKNRSVIPFSHDHPRPMQVFYGDEWQQRANARIMAALMGTLPGKKLTFMGNELNLREAFDVHQPLRWDRADTEVQECARAVNQLYMNHRALWGQDFSVDHFHWLHENTDAGIFAYRRTDGEGASLVTVVNLTPVPFDEYWLPYPVPTKGLKRAYEVLNTDAKAYGGTNNQLNYSIQIGRDGSGEATALKLSVPPLGVVVLNEDYF